jgi:hypothetical protein
VRHGARVGHTFAGFGTCSLCRRLESGHSRPERVSGQGFFNTEEERGPRWATEKGVRSSDEAPQAFFQAKCVEVEQQADRKTAHA